MLTGRYTLGYFVPAPAASAAPTFAFISYATGGRWIGRRGDAALSELAPADKLIRKAVAVQGLRGAVDGVGQELGLGGELEKILGKFVGCKERSVSICLERSLERFRTCEIGRQTLAQRALDPLVKLVLSRRARHATGNRSRRHRRLYFR